MSMGYELGILLSYAVGIILLYVIGYILLVPVKIVWRLILNSLIGGAALLVINLIGANFGVHLPLNIMNAILVGLLGVPGVGLVAILEYLVL